MENKYYKPIKCLYEKLIAHPCGCTFSLEQHLGGFMIICSKNGQREWDVICNWGSYGGDSGKLEEMGLFDKEEDEDSVTGWLTPQQVFNKFIEKYEDWSEYESWYKEQ